MTDLQRIVAALRGDGFDIETVEDGAVVKAGDSRVALFAEDAEDGVLVRLHLDLELYVDEEALSEVLLGVNMLNTGLDHGVLILEPVDGEEDEDPDPQESSLTFAVLGRSSLLLSDLSAAELARLKGHLRRFETELVGAVERSLQGGSGLKA